MFAAAKDGNTKFGKREWTAATIPAGLNFLAMFLWMPLLWGLSGVVGLGIRVAIVATILVLTAWLQFRLIHVLLWPHKCRLMSEVGYEVCVRCAFPLGDIPAEVTRCPECGTARTVVSAAL
jgi:hypothetical protein